MTSPATESQPSDATPKRAVLIVNTKSRRGKDWYQQARQGLREHGIELESANGFTTIGELLAGTQAAIARKVPLIVAGGGDGTFSAIARYFVGSESVLGVLPLGTGNAFARDLGIPSDVGEACRIIAEGRVSKVDLGTTPNDFFVNVATVGLSTRIAQELTGPLKRTFGRFVYAIATTRALARVKPFTAYLKTENGEAEFETLQIVIGNGRYHAGPFPLSPHASITEGKLSLYALMTTNKATLLKLGLYLTSGHHVDLGNVHYQDTAGGELRTLPSMSVTIDGEVCAKTPLRFGIAPGALKVITPESFVG